jgi:transposase-like protein
MAVAQETGMSYAKVQKMLAGLRKTMLADVPPAFSGICEADETFVGGQWKNKRRYIRRGVKAKSGQGTFKSPVTGVYSRQHKQVRVQVIEGRTGPLYWAFIRSCLAADAVLYTDGFKMNRGLANRFGVIHEYVDHAGGEFVRGDVHTNAIEGFWGYLKRNLMAIGGIRRDKLPLFVGEFVWRFNYRQLSHEQQVERLLEQLPKASFGGGN